MHAENNMINRDQWTIVSYADDNKILRKDPKVVTKALEIIKDNFRDLVMHREDTVKKFDF